MLQFLSKTFPFGGVTSQILLRSLLEVLINNLVLFSNLFPVNSLFMFLYVLMGSCAATEYRASSPLPQDLFSCLWMVKLLIIFPHVSYCFSLFYL